MSAFYGTFTTSYQYSISTSYCNYWYSSTNWQIWRQFIPLTYSMLCKHISFMMLDYDVNYRCLILLYKWHVPANMPSHLAIVVTLQLQCSSCSVHCTGNEWCKALFNSFSKVASFLVAFSSSLFDQSKTRHFSLVTRHWQHFRLFRCKTTCSFSQQCLIG